MASSSYKYQFKVQHKHVQWTWPADMMMLWSREAWTEPVDTGHQCLYKAWMEPVDTGQQCWHRTPVFLQGGLLTQDTSVSTGRPVDTGHQCFHREAWTEPVDTGHQCWHREAWTEDTRETWTEPVDTGHVFPQGGLNKAEPVDTGHQCFYTTGNKTLTSSGWRHPPILFHSPLHPSSAVLPPSTSSCMLHHPTLRLWSVHRESERAR